MKRAIFRSATSVLAACAFLLSTASVFAQDLRVVLKGHDPVAYFTEGKPVKGDPKLSYDWDEGRYYFSSAKHRDLFAANPERYAPQFGGYCTGSMSGGATREGDPEAWIIRDGKLYVFGATKFKDIAEKDSAYLPSKIPGAVKNWNDKKSRAS